MQAYVLLSWRPGGRNFFEAQCSVQGGVVNGKDRGIANALAHFREHRPDILPPRGKGKPKGFVMLASKWREAIKPKPRAGAVKDLGKPIVSDKQKEVLDAEMLEHCGE